jgi:hypothetical protein
VSDVADPHKALGDVSEYNQSFWFNNGAVAKNIYELVNIIESCDKSVFEYHVNSEKNDFYNWVLNILGDEILAKRVKKELDQKKFAKKIRRRIKELEKA